MKYAVCDIGSNTIRLCVYELENGKIKTLVNNKEHTELAKYIENNLISEEGREAAVEAILKHKETVFELGIEKPMYFATAALRNIENSKEAVAKISEKSGVFIDVISGEEEAMCDFLGATCDFEILEGVVCDIGGGSSEIVYFKNGEMCGGCSLPIGSLLAYKKFVANEFPDSKETENLKNEIGKLFDEQAFDIPGGLVLCGIGGSICSALSLYNMYYGLTSNMDMECEKFHKMLLEILISDNKRDLISKVSKSRIYTLLPGMIILDKIVSMLEISLIKVTYNGVREGYLIKNVI